MVVERPARPTPEELQAFNAQDERPVFFLTGHGGGGHTATARAIKDALLEQGVSWAPNVEIVDVGPTIERAIHGWAQRCLPSGDDIYNWLISWGLYNLASLSGKVARSVASSNHHIIVDCFASMWRERRPALVVCFVPYFNEAFRESLAAEVPGVRLVTVVTDFESSNVHYWIPPRNNATNHLIVAGTEALQAQAREAGYEDWLVRTSGMVVHPSYYSLRPIARVEGQRPKLVVFFGAFPPEGRTKRIVRNAVASHPELDFVVLCGHGARLRQALAAVPNCQTEGFIPATRIREHFAGAVGVLGKPGPGAVSEAAVCHVPFVADRDVMPQEECVLQWMERRGVGVAIDSLERLPADLLQRLQACKRALGKIEQNRAVFETCEALCEMVSHTGVKAGVPLTVTDAAAPAPTIPGDPSIGGSEPRPSRRRPSPAAPTQ